MLYKNNKYLIEWGADKTQFFNFDNTGQSLGKIGNLSEEVDPKNSTITTATLSYDVFNAADTFSTFLYNKLNTKGKMLYNEKIQLFKIGTAGEKVSIFKGFIRSLTPSNSYETKYRITCETIIGKLKKKLWDREFSTYKNETIQEINTNRMAQGFVMSEKVLEQGEPAVKVINYTGHILECLKGMFQMALSDPVLSSQAMFLDSNYLDFLDITSFNKIKGELSNPIYNITFEWSERIDNLFEFFQKQIFQAVGILPIITGEGKLKIALHQQPTVTQGIKSLDNSTIIKYSDRDINNDNIINNIVCRYDYRNDKFMNSLMRNDEDSFKFFGNQLIPESPKTYEFKSLNGLSPAGKTSFCNNIMDRMFSRFAREINTISLEVPIQIGYNIELGEFVNVEGKNIIDWDTGTRGFAGSVPTVDPYAKWNNGDSWGGFITNNSLGTAPNGHIVIDTKTEEIVTDLLRGSSRSMLSNHAFCDSWLKDQGVV